MDLKSILSLAMLGLALIFVAVGVLKNRKNHWIYAATRLAVVILAIVFGVLVSNLLGKALASLLWSVISDGVVEGDLAEAMDSVPSLENVFIGLVSSVIALLLFVIVFFVMKAILNAVTKPFVRKIIAKKDVKHTAAYEQFGESDGKDLRGRDKKKFKKKVLRTARPNVFGMVGGALVCLFIWVALFAPLVGISEVFYEGVALLQTVDDVDEDMEVVVEIADAAANNAGSKTITFLGGRPIANSLLSFGVNGQSVNIRQELRFFSVAGDAFLYLDNDDMETGVAAEKLRRVSDEFAKTDLLPSLLPEICHAAYGEWEQGKEFLGMEKPTVEDDDTLLDPILTAMADSTYDTVKVDVDTILDLVADAVEKNAIERMDDNAVQLFSDTEFSSSMLRTLLSNERLDSAVGGFLRFGLKSVGDEFGMHRGDNIYDRFVDSMYVATVSRPAVADLAVQYELIFAQYGLELREGSAQLLANQVANSLYTRRSSIDREDVSKTLSTARVIGLNNEEFSLNAQTVPEHSVLVFIDQLTFDSHQVSNTNTEAETLAKALAEVAKIVEKMDGSDFSAADSVQNIGYAMDLLKTTDTVGNENVQYLVTGLIQAKNFQDSMGLSVFEATDIAKSVVEGAQKKNYYDLMTSIGETIRVLESVNNTDQPLKDSVSALMNTLDANSAKVLQSMAKPSVMISNGVPEENAEASANLMSDMFGNLADMGESMSQEEFQREADAVANLTNLAMNATLSDGGATFGAEGSLGVTEEEFVNQVLDSNVASKTLRDTVYENDQTAPTVDPLNSGINLSEAEENNVLETLNNRWANEDTDNAEVRQNYVALGAMVNMELNITASGIQRAQ